MNKVEIINMPLIPHLITNGDAIDCNFVNFLRKFRKQLEDIISNHELVDGGIITLDKSMFTTDIFRERVKSYLQCILMAEADPFTGKCKYEHMMRMDEEYLDKYISSFVVSDENDTLWFLEIYKYTFGPSAGFSSCELRISESE